MLLGFGYNVQKDVYVLVHLFGHCVPVLEGCTRFRYNIPNHNQTTPTNQLSKPELPW